MQRNRLMTRMFKRIQAFRFYKKACLLVYFSLMLIFLGSTECPYVGAEWNPTGNAIGGGPGYGDSLRHQDADYVVHNLNQFLSALSVAGDGNIIYIWDTCQLNMNGHSQKVIPAGVTIASGRGRTLNDTISWGALVYYDSVGAAQWEMFRLANDGKSRITGIRFRGSYSCLEGRVVGDSFTMPIPGEAAICIYADSCEIDNCEFWGFGYAAVFSNAGSGSHLHHNYFHDGNHVYHGYGVAVSGTAKRVLIEANYFDNHLAHILGCSGPNSIHSSYEARWNIHGYHAAHHVIDRHRGVGDSCAADYIHHNSIRFTGHTITNATGVGIIGFPIDSVYIHDNWFWSDDEESSIRIWPGGAFRIWGNHFTETPPQGLSERIPIANIYASVDSGSPPLTVTFKAWGSYDPDGNLRAFYWNFGDSNSVDNYARYTDIRDSAQHTFHEIGVYRVELMVTDDAGITAVNYVDIKVAPPDGRNWISAWVKDRYHGRRAGYYSLQIMIDNWIAWEKDVAGEDDWEHVIIDVTDSLSGKDSVSIAFRLYCKRDTNEFHTIGLKTFWDDVVIFGANVINGNFEHGPWIGTAECTDGNWFASRSTHYYCWNWSGNTRSGNGAYFLGRMYDDVATAGDYCQIAQTVSIGPVSTSGQDMDSVFFNVTPNPALKSALFAYQTPVRSDVSMKIYDTNGRLVKTLMDETHESGLYETHWDGSDNRSRKVSNGIYFCKFVSEPIDSGEGYYETKKVVFLR